MAPGTNSLWPELDYAAWQDTRATLQLWTQIAGKIRLTLTPWLNHSWHVPLYVNAKGLTTSPIGHGSRTFEMQFDFSPCMRSTSPSATAAYDVSHCGHRASRTFTAR